MKLKHLVVMSMMTVAAGCTSSHQDAQTTFDKYPVYNGDWEEMVYSPSGDQVLALGPYGTRGAGVAL